MDDDRQDEDAAEEEPPNETRKSRPDFIQADIGRAYDLRKEYYKYTIGIAAALLAFTISFPPTLRVIAVPSLIQVAWVALAIAILCGIAVHYVWAWFFITFRDHDARGRDDVGQKKRRLLNLLRRALEVVLLFALLIGVLGVAIFASENLENLVLKPAAESAAPSRADKAF